METNIETISGQTKLRGTTHRLNRLKNKTQTTTLTLKTNALTLAPEPSDYRVRLFENLPELLTPDMAADALHTTRATVYQWHYRPEKYGVIDDMFLKLGRKLLVRREALKTWVLSRNKNGRNQ